MFSEEELDTVNKNLEILEKNFKDVKDSVGLLYKNFESI